MKSFIFPSSSPLPRPSPPSISSFSNSPNSSAYYTLSSTMFAHFTKDFSLPTSPLSPPSFFPPFPYTFLPPTPFPFFSDCPFTRFPDPPSKLPCATFPPPHPFYLPKTRKQFSRKGRKSMRKDQGPRMRERQRRKVAAATATQST